MSLTLTRLKNDVNGNPRHAVHFLDLERPEDQSSMQSLTLPERYARIVKIANKLGGRRYHCKAYGGGVAFTAYECEMAGIVDRIRALSVNY